MQKALDKILEEYLKQETLVGSENEELDEEILNSLQKCLQEKGVLKEVHAFLRMRLIGVLQGSWPQLFNHLDKDHDLSRIGLDLIQDFLCSHQLLFTFSVFTTELGHSFTPRQGLGKLSSEDAFQILRNLGITGTSIKKILNLYGETKFMSLLDCLIKKQIFGIQLIGNHEHAGAGDVGQFSEFSDTSSENLHPHQIHKIQNKKRALKDRKRNNLHRAGVLSIDERFRNLAMELERDKQIQLQIAIDRFKQEETTKIREELETELKFNFLKKEKELLANYEEKVNHLEKDLKREKELWNLDKLQKEKEIYERREELLLAIQSVRQNENIGFVIQKQEQELKEGVTLTFEPTLDLSTSKPSTFSPIHQPNPFHLKSSQQREMERIYLLKEAKLRSQIDKLEKEKQEMATKISSSGDLRSKLKLSKPLLQPVKPKSESKIRPLVVHVPVTKTSKLAIQTLPIGQELQHSAPHPDTIAFLQYQLECQTEEIEKLRHLIHTSGTIMSPLSPTMTPKDLRNSQMTSPIIPPALISNDLEKFLKEAKQRLLNIEKEAEAVEVTLTQLNNSKPESNLVVLEEMLPSASQLPVPPSIPSFIYNRLTSIQRDSKPDLRFSQISTNQRTSIPPMPKSHVSFTSPPRQNGEGEYSKFTTFNFHPKILDSMTSFRNDKLDNTCISGEESLSETCSTSTVLRSEISHQMIPDKVKGEQIREEEYVSSESVSLDRSASGITPEFDGNVKAAELRKPEAIGNIETLSKNEDSEESSLKSQILRDQASRSGALVTNKIGMKVKRSTSVGNGETINSKNEGTTTRRDENVISLPQHVISIEVDKRDSHLEKDLEFQDVIPNRIKNGPPPFLTESNTKSAFHSMDFTSSLPTEFDFEEPDLQNLENDDDEDPIRISQMVPDQSFWNM